MGIANFSARVLVAALADLGAWSDANARHVHEYIPTRHPLRKWHRTCELTLA